MLLTLVHTSTLTQVSFISLDILSADKDFFEYPVNFISIFSRFRYISSFSPS